MSLSQFPVEAHQQEIVRLNEEIDNDLIANRYVARRGCFDNVMCFIKKKRKVVHPYCSTGSWKNISGGLNFVTQTWRWLTNAMIQMPCTNWTGLNVKWSGNQVITKTISAWRRRSENLLKLSFMSLFKAKEFCTESIPSTSWLGEWMDVNRWIVFIRILGYKTISWFGVGI